MSNELQVYKDKHVEIAEQMFDEQQTVFLELLQHHGPSIMSRFKAGFLEVIKDSRDDAKMMNLIESRHHSVMDCVYKAAKAGLSLSKNDRESHIIVRGGKATFQLGYMAVVQGLRREGTFYDPVVAPVYEGCVFRFNHADPSSLYHEPYMVAGNDKGKLKFWYFFCERKDGGPSYARIITLDEIEKSRASSQTQYIWKNNQHAMEMKTVYLRGARYLPMTPDIGDLANEEFIEMTKTEPEPAQRKQSTVKTGHGSRRDLHKPVDDEPIDATYNDEDYSQEVDFPDNFDEPPQEELNPQSLINQKSVYAAIDLAGSTTIAIGKKIGIDSNDADSISAIQHELDKLNSSGFCFKKNRTYFSVHKVLYKSIESTPDETLIGHVESIENFHDTMLNMDTVKTIIDNDNNILNNNGKLRVGG